MFRTKDWLLVGTILLAVALGSAHATPFDGVLVIAQTPQADQEKEKEKKPPQRPSPPPPQHAVVVAAVPAWRVVAAPHTRYSHPHPRRRSARHSYSSTWTPRVSKLLTQTTAALNAFAV